CFFFQAEDGIRDFHVTGVQTCALPIYKEDAILLNYGYQGMVSAIDCLVDRHDIIVYDSESHACIIDGVRLHMGKRFVYPHNDIRSEERRVGKECRSRGRVAMKYRNRAA